MYSGMGSVRLMSDISNWFSFSLVPDQIGLDRIWGRGWGPGGGFGDGVWGQGLRGFGLVF